MKPKTPTQCPKCKRNIIDIVHFHEPDQLGIQAVIHHKATPIEGLFGALISYSDNCYLTESEYQGLVK